MVINPEVLDILREVGNLTGEASIGRGLLTCAGVAAAVTATGFRVLRRNGGKPERVKVTVDAPQGEKVLVQLGGNDVEEG